MFKYWGKVKIQRLPRKKKKLMKKKLKGLELPDFYSELASAGCNGKVSGGTYVWMID